MVLDVTERHWAEERLRESEAQYRRLVELAQEGIWQIDAEHKTVYVNQKMADLVGRTQEEMLGRPVSAFLDEEGQAVGRCPVCPSTRRGATADFDVELRGKDGGEVWVHVTASAFFDRQGGYLGGMAMVTDIGRRKQEERALEQARAAAEELASLRQEQVEEAQAMSAVSQALAGTLEPQRLYQVILEQAERILHCDHTCVLLHEDGWATVAASRGMVAQPDGARLFALAAVEPVTVYGANGQPALIADTSAMRWIDVPPLVGAFAVRSAIVVPLVLDGTVVGSFNVDSFTAKFYTEQHLARAVALGERVTQALRNVRLFQLEQQRTRSAEELAHLKEDFVASVSHELRTPLTAILRLCRNPGGAVDQAGRCAQAGADPQDRGGRQPAATGGGGSADAQQPGAPRPRTGSRAGGAGQRAAPGERRGAGRLPGPAHRVRRAVCVSRCWPILAGPPACSSMCWTMPPNTLRWAARSRSAAAWRRAWAWCGCGTTGRVCPKMVAIASSRGSVGWRGAARGQDTWGPGWGCISVAVWWRRWAATWIWKRPGRRAVPSACGCRPFPPNVTPVP